LLICIVVHHSVIHHSLAGLGGEILLTLLIGFGVGFKTPAAGCSRESWLIGANWEAEGGHVVEGWRQGMGWHGTTADGAWEDSLVHVAQVSAHSVGACCHTLVVLSWVSTCSTRVVVANIAAMGEAVVPVLVPLYWQGAAWGLISPIATAIAIVAAIATTTTVCIVTAATAAVAATTIVIAATATTVVVAATTAVASTIATALFPPRCWSWPHPFWGHCGCCWGGWRVPTAWQSI
jgi:hypothetical protein